jgi:uncharacterized protein YbcC (UPF0753/DUF2309 family)
MTRPAADTCLEAARFALAAQPPAFPLHATVAVNPWLGYGGQRRTEVARRQSHLAGASLTASLEQFRKTRGEGLWGDGDLTQALAEFGDAAAHLSLAQLKSWLWRGDQAPLAPLPTLLDLAETLDGRPWGTAMEESLGRWALSAFDFGQALWRDGLEGAPLRSWEAWRQTDDLAGRFGVAGLAPPQSLELAVALRQAAADLALTDAMMPAYFERLAYTLGGWVQHGQWLAWSGDGESAGMTLLLARLAWERAALASSLELLEPWRALQAAYAALAEPALRVRPQDVIQRALELGAARALEARLASAKAPPVPAAPPALQAVFCIDVRSEPFRRALEACSERIETFGFAGFFGLALAHEGEDGGEARCPVLLTPAVASAPEAETGGFRRAFVRSAKALSTLGASALTYVEALGWGHGLALLREGAGKAPPPAPTPAFENLPLPARIAQAQGILTPLGLTEGFAPLVLLVGHGAALDNNPFASAYQCGACGGHDGGVNARLLAALLNDSAVRSGLAEQGIVIPGETRFLAALHDTAADTVTCFPESLALLSGEQQSTLAHWLRSAERHAQAARAPRLPGAEASNLGLRARHWAEPRPEWGLAGAQAFIAAPRAHSRSVDLGGRVFLHSYDPARDPEGKTLELILTAPVVVASWIALQYFGVAAAPEQFGSGNKLLHNVAGGLGVFEGRRPVLRTGLPLQALSDGAALQHVPLALAVYLEASKEAVLAILARHPEVRALFDNGWLSLALLASGRVVARYAEGRFSAPPAAEAAAA